MAPGYDDDPSLLPSAKDLPTGRLEGDDSSGDESDDQTRFALPRERGLQAGDVLKDRFELVRELGAGGMGTVFQALDRLKVEARDRQPYVAIKVVGREFQRHQISFIAFQREARRAQSLAHPNIVRVYDFDRDGPHAFITMEYLSGRSLDKIIKSRASAEISLEEALRVLKPIGSALSFAHDNGIIHCDIKPSNIFVTDEGVVKVIDFGIARAVKRPDAEHTVFDGGTLNAASVMYASPELREGDAEPSPRDDVYSLACVAYELLTGRHPFGRQPPISAAEREPPKPQGLTHKQWLGLRRALAFERDRRTPTVQQFLADLSAPADRRPYVLAVSAAAVLALGIVGALVFGGKEQEQLANLPEPPVAAVEEPSDDPCLPQGSIDFAALQSMEGCPADKLYRTAQRLVAENDADTALPLVRAAAGKGHGPSALLLGEWYDPLQREEKASPIPEPDRERAFEWYRKAEAYGEKEAGERLALLTDGSSEQNPPAMITPLTPSKPATPAEPHRPTPEPQAPAEAMPMSIPERNGVQAAARGSTPKTPELMSRTGARCADVLHRLQLGESLSDQDRSYLQRECGR